MNEEHKDCGSCRFRIHCAIQQEMLACGDHEKATSIAEDKLRDAAPDLLAACKAQHEAIDQLFALLINNSSNRFFPSKSGQPWGALLQGQAALDKVMGAKS